VDEDVAIVKNVLDHPTASSFTWMDLDDIQASVDALKEQYPNNAYVLLKDYQIVPVSFYK